MTNRIIDIHPVDKPVCDLNSQNMFRVEVSCMKCYPDVFASPPPYEMAFLIWSCPPWFLMLGIPPLWMKSYNEFLQEIRKEELHLKPNEALVPVAHFHKVTQLF
jgi:hypothetical protein